MKAKIAILGFGTVGSGVAELIEMNKKHIASRQNIELEVKSIVDVRDFPGSPWERKIVHDFSVVEQDPEIVLVVETIGGKGVAYEFTKRALASGKHVVTSNKELVAVHGAELMELATEHGVRYLFEAAVGGGVPLLRPMRQCLAANEITRLYGILNGTTNYILTQMKYHHTPFSDALKDAQRLGYAEQNPSADIDGIDTCRKICILGDMVSGHEIDPASIPTEGISAIVPEDFAMANEAGYEIRLLGRMEKTEDGKCYIFVAPHLIPASNPLSGVEDVFNGILVRGNAVDDVMFYGKGAGKLPTASAVAGDILDVLRHPYDNHPDWSASKKMRPSDIHQYVSRWYIRSEQAFTVPGGISLKTSGNCFAVITPALSGNEVKEIVKGLSENSITLRILED